MRSGIPLNDDDRWPWLAQINEHIRANSAVLQVLACSALKVSYRRRLMQGLEGEVHFLFLDAPQEVLARHHRERVHEYMPATLLESQLSTLERPVPGEPVSVISVAGSEDESFLEILEVLRRLGISC
jgi:gluconokinase